MEQKENGQYLNVKKWALRGKNHHKLLMSKCYT